MCFGSSSAVTMFVSYIWSLFFQLSWPISSSPQNAQQPWSHTQENNPARAPLQPCATARDISLGQTLGADWQAGSPQLPLTWTWVSSIQRENGHKGVQRLSAADSSCVKQSLLSITGLCTDLLSSISPVDVYRIYSIYADEQMRSALPSISKYQLRNSASITLKHFYNLCWLSIPGWFLLHIKRAKVK